MSGTKEDTASGREFFHDMRRRGLADPLLVISDGAPGLIRAIEECFPRAARAARIVRERWRLRGLCDCEVSLAPKSRLAA